MIDSRTVALLCGATMEAIIVGECAPSLHGVSSGGFMYLHARSSQVASNQMVTNEIAACSAGQDLFKIESINLSHVVADISVLRILCPA